MKVDDVIICEELGLGAFGKVCKGNMKNPSRMTHGSFVHKAFQVEAKPTITVVVKMLQGIKCVKFQYYFSFINIYLLNLYFNR